jgi:hypothetical protein
MSFWTDGRIEPKRQNRWVVQFDGLTAGNLYYASKVSRPTLEVSNKEHKFLNHTFNYPGRVKWNPVTLTIVDVQGAGVDPATDSGGLNRLMALLASSGYVVPNSPAGAALGTIAKSRAIGAVSTPVGGQTGGNGVTIKMIGSQGDGVAVETWVLRNAFITKITPSELSYEDDGIATVDIELTYDYCEVAGQFRPTDGGQGTTFAGAAPGLNTIVPGTGPGPGGRP